MLAITEGGLLTSGDVARMFGVTTETVRDWHKVGVTRLGRHVRLAGRFAGTKLRFRREDVEAFDRACNGEDVAPAPTAEAPRRDPELAEMVRRRR